MDFRVLGPVEALESGQPLALHGARQRALLALLLLQRGAPMSVDRLVDELWSEHGAAPDKTLQVAVSRLRSALGQAASRLVRTPAGYRLHTEPGELDVDRFERLAEEGRQALLNGSPEHAAARLRAALEEWRGPPLGGIGDDVPFADVEATRLEAERDAALEDRIEADLALGRHAEVAGELEALVAREPLRERRRGQLMLALFRTGRQGEALEAFRDGARVLDAELGLRPGSELERLQRAILTGDAALDAPTRSHAAEAPASARRATATILFTDLAGSTPMRAALGDEAADAVRREHDGRLRDVLALHGGREVKALGDGLMAVHEAAGDARAGRRCSPTWSPASPARPTRYTCRWGRSPRRRWRRCSSTPVARPSWPAACTPRRTATRSSSASSCKHSESTARRSRRASATSSADGSRG